MLDKVEIAVNKELYSDIMYCSDWLECEPFPLLEILQPDGIRRLKEHAEWLKPLEDDPSTDEKTLSAIKLLKNGIRIDSHTKSQIMKAQIAREKSRIN